MSEDKPNLKVARRDFLGGVGIAGAAAALSPVTPAVAQTPAQAKDQAKDQPPAPQAAGYTYAFALPERHEQPSALSIPRVGVHRGNGVPVLRLKETRPYLAVRTSPLWTGARRAAWAAKGTAGRVSRGAAPRR